MVLRGRGSTTEIWSTIIWRCKLGEHDRPKWGRSPTYSGNSVKTRVRRIQGEFPQDANLCRICGKVSIANRGFPLFLYSRLLNEGCRLNSEIDGVIYCLKRVRSLPTETNNNIDKQTRHRRLSRVFTSKASLSYEKVLKYPSLSYLLKAIQIVSLFRGPSTYIYTLLAK